MRYDWMQWTTPGLDSWMSRPFVWVIGRLCWRTNATPTLIARLFTVGTVMLFTVSAFMAADLFSTVLWIAVPLLFAGIMLVDAIPRWERLSARLWEGVVPVEFASHVRACSHQRVIDVLAVVIGSAVTATGVWQPIAEYALIMAGWLFSAAGWYCLTMAYRPRPKARSRQKVRFPRLATVGAE